MARGGKRPGAGRPKAQKSGTPDAKGPPIGEAPPAAPRPSPKIKRIKAAKIKAPASSRGGARPGAGRPKSDRAKADRPDAPGAQPSPDDTANLRRRVALCASAGMDAPTIAAALGVHEATLRVDFAHELANGTAIVRADNLAALSAAAQDGNAAAAKALLAIADKVAPGPVAPPGAGSAGGGDATARALRILQGGKK